MILFGAGSSIPFGIPGMFDFTEEFINTQEFDKEFVKEIKEAVLNSKKTIGIPLSFDLESLLSILTDVAEIKPTKPISVATAALLIRKGLSIEQLRAKYKKPALDTFSKLNAFIFSTCMKPISDGRSKKDFSAFNRFYGPLLTILNNGSLKEKEPSIRNENRQNIHEIFSTNWDLCFKTWADNINMPIKEWIKTDDQNFQVLSVDIPREDFGRPQQYLGFRFTPLHGSLDLFRRERLKGDGSHEEICKMPDPDIFFGNSKDNLKDLFMIYPLEAVGYEESVKSPYLDMLNYLKITLVREKVIFIIGYSLRDPTIGSLIEQVVAEKVRKGQLKPFSSDIKTRLKEAHNSINGFKIIVINPDVDGLIENLKRQSSTNLLHTFIPIPLSFPKTNDPNFEKKFGVLLNELIFQLTEIGHFNLSEAETMVRIIKANYGIEIVKEK